MKWYVLSVGLLLLFAIIYRSVLAHNKKLKCQRMQEENKLSQKQLLQKESGQYWRNLQQQWRSEFARAPKPLWDAIPESDPRFDQITEHRRKINTALYRCGRLEEWGSDQYSLEQHREFYFRLLALYQSYEPELRERRFHNDWRVGRLLILEAERTKRWKELPVELWDAYWFAMGCGPTETAQKYMDGVFNKDPYRELDPLKKIPKFVAEQARKELGV